MLTSMTGFGRGEINEKGYRVVLEVRSLNNRYLDIYVKILRRFSEFEDEMKAVTREYLSRGKIEISVNIEGLQNAIEDVAINLGLARKYFEALDELSRQFNQPIDLKPENLLNFEGIFERVIPEELSQILKKSVLKTLKSALEELTKHKNEEGRNLTKDCRERILKISGSVRKIRKLVNERRRQDYENLMNRIMKVVKDLEKVDPGRIETEVAVMAERFDVSEECVRLDSHLKLFKSALSQSGPVGRKLDFILQEINREANTISSKSNNFNISEEVVQIKEEIERLKEQIRNVE